MAEESYPGQADNSAGTSDYNAMDFIIRQIAGKMCTATLVLVKAVRPDAGVVDVQPMVAQIDGDGKGRPHGTVHNIPYFRVQGGANAVIIDPAAGDIGLAVFAREDISSVKVNKKPSLPGSRRRYDYADGVYIGGLLNGTPTQFLRIDDDGVTITAAEGKSVVINAPGGATINSAGAVTLTADGMTTVTNDMTVSGALHVVGASSLDGAITAADTLAVSGTLTATGGATIGGKDFATHKHSGVTVGTGQTGVMV